MTHDTKNEGSAPLTDNAEPTPVTAPKARQPDLGALIDERLQAALAPLLERLAPAPEPAKVADPVAAAELEKLRKDLGAERKRAQDDKRAAHEASAFASLKSKLAANVRPEMLDVAAEWIFHARKAVAVDERGRVNATWDGAAYDSIDDLAQAFASSKAAAPFLAPPKPTGQAPAKGAAAPQRLANGSIGANVNDRLAALRAAGYDV